MLRRPVVSGSFYPADPEELTDFIKESTPPGAVPGDITAAIMPHAGYIYSGRVAVETAANIKPKKLIVILGPNHKGRGKPFAVYPEGSWQTPLGNIPVDATLAKGLVKTRALSADTEAHAREHSIEVELPILKYFFSDFKFVPIACTETEAGVYAEIAAVISEQLKASEKIDNALIVASSDMTHYEPEDIAAGQDKYALEAILNLDTRSLLARVKEKNISLCGVAPVAITLETLKLMGGKKSRLIRYTSSAEASGDSSSVVGYAGVVFYG